MSLVVTETINFLHELDLLEVHLDEHSKFIDRIIVVESEVTYSGMEKPLYFEKNKNRFSRFNVEYDVVPKELFIKIPPSYGEEDAKKWFNSRRQNREIQQKYMFDKYRKGSDYFCNTDTDEVWSRDAWYQLERVLQTKQYHYIIPKVRDFAYFVDSLGWATRHYRITRSDLANHFKQDGPKYKTRDIGWHFSSTFKDPVDLWMKGVGLAQSLGYRGWANVPNPDVCARMLKDNISPFLNSKIKVKCVMPKDSLHWAPKFVRNNPDKFPWLPEELRTGIYVSPWKLPVIGGPEDE